MLAYAAHRRPRAQLRPATLILILGGHLAAIAALMLAGGPIVDRFVPNKTTVELLPDEPEPLPPPPERAVEPPPAPAPDLFIPQREVELAPSEPTILQNVPIPNLEPGPVTEPALPVRTVPIAPTPTPAATTEPRLDTPAHLMEPPYPASKQNAGEEARLHLSLSIDAKGKVVAVEPIGSADATFLAAARKHLLRYWRYKPATEGGVPVAATKSIWLTFTLR